MPDLVSRPTGPGLLVDIICETFAGEVIFVGAHPDIRVEFPAITTEVIYVKSLARYLF